MLDCAPFRPAALALAPFLLLACSNDALPAGDASLARDAGADARSPAPDKDGGPSEPGPSPGVDGGTCSPTPTLSLEPIWMAGGPGDRDELGKFGKPDAIFLDPRGILIAGDEDEDYEEVHLYDTTTEDPSERADYITPLVDWGAPESTGPGGAGPLEFRGVSGFAQSPVTGELVIVEQGNGRLQILAPAPALADPAASPYYVFDRFQGAFAPDMNNPADGEFARLQAARFDSLGRLYLSDDAKRNAVTARRDVQIFEPNGDFVARFGDGSYGALGEDGNLQEPENFVIDEARNRIYVCDEGPGNIAVYNYDDLAFIQRLGDGAGVPNGIDIDARGYLYVVYEGEADETGIRIYDPNTFEELTRFGELSASPALPGTFDSPDTLIISLDQDLLLQADQGNDRIQAFRLSELQQLACLRQLSLRAPSRVVDGHATVVRIDLLDAAGGIERGQFDATAKLSARIVGAGGGTKLSVSPNKLDLTNGVGAGAIEFGAIGDAEFIELTVEVGGLTATERIEVQDPTERTEITGESPSGKQNWERSSGIVVLSGDVTVTGALELEAGTLVMLEPGANLTINGSIDSHGSAKEPVVFFAADASDPWGQIRIEGDGHARLEHTFVTGGGATPAEGHCCGPVLRAEGAEVDLRYAVLTDMDAKALLTRGSSVNILGSVFSHLQMGPELSDSPSTIADSWFVDMQSPDDDDCLYLHRPNGSSVTSCVVAHCGDDGIDSNHSDATIRDVIVRDVADKAVSTLAGALVIEDSLLVRADWGVVIKAIADDGPVGVTVRRTTLAAHRMGGVWVRNDDGPGAQIGATLARLVIADSGAGIQSDYDIADIKVSRSLAPMGTGAVEDEVRSGAPRFINSAADNWRLNPLSPGASLSSGGGPVGWPGTPL